MPHQPVSARDLNTYRLPTLIVMRKSGSVGNLMKKIIKAEKATATLHSHMVIHEACRRYLASLLIVQDREAFDAFAKDALITGLKRQLKGRDDTLRAMWQATEVDPKLASKRFKRLEHLWKKRAPVAEVVALLKHYGWEKPIPGVTRPKARKVEDDDTVSADAGDAGGDGRDLGASKPDSGDRLSTVTIKGVPRAFKLPKGGDIILRGRVVKRVGDELTVADAEFDC